MKPILTIKQKCNCNCHQDKFKHYVCGCEATCTQTTEIYLLRDFECSCVQINKVVAGKMKSYCYLCKNKGYKIPKEYEPYEIKKVSEVNSVELDIIAHRTNLKEDDKVVIRWTMTSI